MVLREVKKDIKLFINIVEVDTLPLDIPKWKQASPVHITC